MRSFFYYEIFKAQEATLSSIQTRDIVLFIKQYLREQLLNSKDQEIRDSKLTQALVDLLFSIVSSMHKKKRVASSPYDSMANIFDGFTMKLLDKCLHMEAFRVLLSHFLKKREFWPKDRRCDDLQYGIIYVQRLLFEVNNLI